MFTDSALQVLRDIKSTSRTRDTAVWVIRPSVYRMSDGKRFRTYSFFLARKNDKFSDNYIEIDGEYYDVNKSIVRVFTKFSEKRNKHMLYVETQSGNIHKLTSTIAGMKK